MDRKIKIVSAVVIILILAAGGFFWWLSYYRSLIADQLNRLYSAEMSVPQDFIIEETSNGKIINNPKDGFSFKVPDNWTIERAGSDWGYLHFYSPNKIKKDDILLSGCEITPYVLYVKTNFRVIKEGIKELDKEMSARSIQEIVKIDGYDALKSTIEVSKLNMYGISMHIPTDDKLYEIIFGANLKDKESCSQEFEEFLRTVLIK